jgi:hypothetical protein
VKLKELIKLVGIKIILNLAFLAIKLLVNIVFISKGYNKLPTLGS